MKTEKCLYGYFIIDNVIISSTEFNLSKINNGTIIYEVIRVIGGKPLFFKEHFNRFHSSILTKEIVTVLDYESILAQIKTLINKNHLTEGNIKYQISTNPSNTASFSAWIQPHYYPPSQQYEVGVNVSTIDEQRNNPNLKIYNKDYISKVNRKLQDSSTFEVLLTNQYNDITEGSRSNVFFIKDNSVFTPKTEQVLPGITRQKIITWIKKNRIVLIEEPINLKSIENYESAFITGTSIKAMPISNINSVTFDTNNSLLNKIRSGYDEIIENDLISFSWSS